MDRGSFLVGAAALPRLLVGRPQEAFIDAFLAMWDRNRVYTLEVAQAMPAGDWQFRPVPEVRSFAEQWIHVAQANVAWARMLGGASVRGLPDAPAPSAEPTGILGFLDGAFQAVSDAVGGSTEARLDARVPWNRRLGDATDHSLRGIALTAWHHTAHHRGQCVIYLRIRGITPPGYVD